MFPITIYKKKNSLRRLQWNAFSFAIHTKKGGEQLGDLALTDVRAAD